MHPFLSEAFPAPVCPFGKLGTHFHFWHRQRMAASTAAMVLAPIYLAQKGNRLVYIHFYWQVQEDQLEKAMEILFAQTL